MIPYLILVFVPFLFSLFAVVSREGGRKVLTFGVDRETRNNNLLLPAFFCILFLLLALRDETVGRDLVKYRYYFEKYSQMELREIFRESDALYVLLNWLVSRFTDNYQSFLALVAALTLFPIWLIYREDKKDDILKIILFVNMSTFVMLFSGLRQSLAISAGLLAYRFVREKKFVWFLVCALVAFGFHHTGFMVFAFYPLYHITIKQKQMLFVVPVLAVIFVFNEQIFSFLTKIMNALLGSKYEVEIEQTGSYTMLIVFAVFAVLAYVYADENRMDKETRSLRNFLLITVVLQCFAPVHALAMRLNYYFIIFIPVAVPKMLQCAEGRFRKLERWVPFALAVFFMCYYLYTVYIGCQTGISALDTYPYVPFWEGLKGIE